MTLSPELDLFSTAKLCELLRTTPGPLDRAVERAGVLPALRVNGVRYFAEPDIERIRAHLTVYTAKGV